MIEEENEDVNKGANVDQLSDLISNVTLEKNDEANRFPFLDDRPTIDFIRTSKVLFVMRGLPGSGKSTLTNKISSTYSDEEMDVPVCSGDDYFTDADGNYLWVKDKLQWVHEQTRKKCVKAMKNLVSPIVVDNTNLTRWAVQKYVNIAHEHNYTVLLVEPRTAHKFDAEILAKKNKHRVGLETIVRKIQSYEVITPYFFGWFMNLKDSTSLIRSAKRVVEKIRNESKSIELKDSFEFKSATTKLHCTSKFIGKEKNLAKTYTTSSVVALHNGQVSELKIVGFLLTNETISAIVKLDSIGDDHKALWDNSFNEKQDSKKVFKNDLFFSKFKETEIKKALDSLEFDSRAHITLACRPKVSNVQAGFDLLSVKLKCVLKPEAVQKVPSEKREFDLTIVDSSMFLVELKKPISYPAIFTGHF